MASKNKKMVVLGTICYYLHQTTIYGTIYYMPMVGGGGLGQHNTGGDPRQSFYPPRPTSTNQTKKKGIEVFI
jgi:hypothetical protein